MHSYQKPFVFFYFCRPFTFLNPGFFCSFRCAGHYRSSRLKSYFSNHQNTNTDSTFQELVYSPPGRFQIPDFLNIQRVSFQTFLKKGLITEFQKYKCIQNSTKTLEIFFYAEHYKLNLPKWTPKQAILKRKSYACELYLPVQFTNLNREEIQLQWILLAHLPLMTKQGHFIINGCPRVLMNQMVRSPGVYFKKMEKKDRETVYCADFIAQRGSWLRLEVDTKKGNIWAKLKRTPKIPIFDFLQAFGLTLPIFSQGVDFAKLRYFFPLKQARQKKKEKVGFESLPYLTNSPSKTEFKNLFTRFQAKKKEEFTSPWRVYWRKLANYYKRQEKYIAKQAAYEDLKNQSEEEQNKRSIRERTPPRKPKVPAQPKKPLWIGKPVWQNFFQSLENLETLLSPPELSLEKNQIFTQKTELEPIQEPRLVEPTVHRLACKKTKFASSFENRQLRAQAQSRAQKFLFRKFQNERTYNLSLLGRARLNQKLGLEIDADHTLLTAQDILAACLILMDLLQGLILSDDIDDLKNRQIHSSGDLIQFQIATGFVRLEKILREKLQKESLNFKALSFSSLFTIQPINQCLREFFGSSPLSQLMDQTNALSELTHKRRLTSLGPGGINRENAGMAIRGIHPTHYGRICPIETPEGQNAGLVNSLTIYARLNDHGFLETPFFKTYKGFVFKGKNPFLFASDQEKNWVLAPGDIQTSTFNFLPPNLRIPSRQKHVFSSVPRNEINFTSMSPLQMISVATSLIPFLEHNDGNRALMGSNMQRQAVPTLRPSKPIVGTGLESRVISDIGHGLQAHQSGFVSYVDSQKILFYSAKLKPQKTFAEVFNARSWGISRVSTAKAKLGSTLPLSRKAKEAAKQRPQSSRVATRGFKLQPQQTPKKKGFFPENSPRQIPPQFRTELFQKQFASKNHTQFEFNLQKKILFSSSEKRAQFTYSPSHQNSEFFCPNFFCIFPFQNKKSRQNFNTKVFFSISNQLFLNTFAGQIKLMPFFYQNFLFFNPQKPQPSSFFSKNAWLLTTLFSHQKILLLWGGQILMLSKTNSRFFSMPNSKFLTLSLQRLQKYSSQSRKAEAKRAKAKKFDGKSQAATKTPNFGDKSCLQIASSDKDSYTSSLVFYNQSLRRCFESQNQESVTLREKKAKAHNKKEAFVSSQFYEPSNLFPQIRFAIFQNLKKKVLYLSFSQKKPWNLTQNSKIPSFFLPFNFYATAFEKILNNLAPLPQLATKKPKFATLEQSTQNTSLNLASASFVPKSQSKGPKTFYLKPFEASFWFQTYFTSLFAPNIGFFKEGSKKFSRHFLKNFLKQRLASKFKNGFPSLNKKKKAPLWKQKSQPSLKKEPLLAPALRLRSKVSDFHLSVFREQTSNLLNRQKFLRDRFFNKNLPLPPKKKFENLPQLATLEQVCGEVAKQKAKKTLPRFSNLVPFQYNLKDYHRSNQDTYLVHRPAVQEGQWLEKGDAFVDSSASVQGELAIGQNIFVGYTPWEGYNFEDAILISERVILDDLYTSLHIERYEVEVCDTEFGMEYITNQISSNCAFLDSTGVVKVGTWVTEGDVLVGKIAPRSEKTPTPYENLLYAILDKKIPQARDTSLRVPKGVQGRVIHVEILETIQKKKGREEYHPLKFVSPNFLPNRKLQSQAAANSLDSFQTTSQNVLSSFSALNFQLGAQTNSQNIAKYATKRFQTRKLQWQTRVQSNKDGVFRHPIVKKKATLLPPPVGNGIQKRFDRKNKALQSLFPYVFPPQKENPTSFSAAKQPAEKIFRFPLLQKLWTKEIQILKKRETLHQQILHQKWAAFKPKKTLFSKILKKRSFLLQTAFQKLSWKGLFFQPNNQIFKITNSLFLLDTFQKPFSPLLSQNFDLKKKSAISKERLNNNFSEVRLTQQNLVLARPKKVHVFLAVKRKLQIGDKIAGRHGNKGIISNILPRQDMPFLPDGTPLDIVLNPLGVPSRMNVGQIFECLLGLAGYHLKQNYKVQPFDEIYGCEASRSFVYSKLYEARLKTGQDWLFNPLFPGKSRLFDGRTGDCFEQPVTVGVAYILKLIHLVDEKIHARSTGPYSLVTQQPLRGRSKQGGQRVGEMEVWSLEGFGAAYILQEILTLKSDDLLGRQLVFTSVLNDLPFYSGVPESFKVLVRELQALCVDLSIYKNKKDKKGKIISTSINTNNLQIL